jgi:hypothetical protein
VIRFATLTAALLGLVLLGLVVIPAWNASSGIVVAQGTKVQVNQGSFAFIPFSASQQSRISGSLSADGEIEAYVLNSTQFTDVDRGGGASPRSYEFASGNVTSVALNLMLPKGSYYLVFYSVPSSSPREVLVTEAIELARG